MLTKISFLKDQEGIDERDWPFPYINRIEYVYKNAQNMNATRTLKNIRKALDKQGFVDIFFTDFEGFWLILT